VDLLRAHVGEDVVEVRAYLRVGAGGSVGVAAAAGRLRGLREDLGACLRIALRDGGRLLLLYRPLYGFREGRGRLAAAASRDQDEGKGNQRERERPGHRARSIPRSAAR
jgi:hypothetical protein